MQQFNVTHRVIRNLTLQTVMGVYDWERVAARPLVFDLWLESARFNVSHEQMQERLRAWVAECNYRLLEALAEHFAQKLISECSCRRVCIAIEKPGALGVAVRVGIRITRYGVAQNPQQNYKPPDSRRCFYANSGGWFA